MVCTYVPDPVLEKNANRQQLLRVCQYKITQALQSQTARTLGQGIQQIPTSERALPAMAKVGLGDL